VLMTRGAGWFSPPNALARKRSAAAASVRTVIFDRAVKGLKLPTVVSDNIAAANEATTHLINQGHRRIGVLVGRRTLDSMTGRVEGYRGALLEHRIKFDETLVVDGIDVGVEAGYSSAKTLLDRKVRPTAMIVLNNLLARLRGFAAQKNNFVK
jgi:DNA-binding LacI/PurR family transcriptional regulator